MGEFRKFKPVDVESVHERGLKKVADLEKLVGWDERIQEIQKNLTLLKSRSEIKKEKIDALTDILNEAQEQTPESERKVKALEEEVQELLQNTSDPIQAELEALKAKMDLGSKEEEQKGKNDEKFDSLPVSDHEVGDELNLG